MKYAIIVSKKDPAGLNIRERLLELYNFEDKENYFEQDNVKIYLAEKESIYCDDIEVDGDIIIFATKHQSAAGKASLSVHIPGNWDKAELGGEDKMLNIAPASLMKSMFIELDKQSKDFEGEVTLEATHHGPTVSKPVMFIEIGSGEEQWNNIDYGKIIATTLMNVLSRDIKEYKSVFAIGGGHYPREMNKILLRTELAIGNICPKYMLEHLDKEIVKQAVDKNLEKIDTVLLDWKGLGQHKEKVAQIIGELGLNIERIQNVLKQHKIL